MKTILVVLTLALACSPALAEDGKAVFENNGCTACHSADRERVGPPLTKIASTYGGSKDELLAFLSGKADPRVEPQKFAIMKPNLTKTQALSDSEKGALADFILSHK